jgi:hypothetical protein
MKSKTLGIGISNAEVTHISISGIWVLLDDHEYFLPFEKYPDFRDATVGQIHNVRIVNGDELEWPDLQLNLSIESFDQPKHVPTLVKAK